MKKIGIFGGAGSGKSVILNILSKNFNSYILEADKIAHKLYEKENAGYNFILELLGENVLNSGKTLDRKKLADILYKDKELLEKVNNFIHPLVWKIIEKEVEEHRNNYEIIAVEAALLPEKKNVDYKISREFFDDIWFIKSEKKIREKRLIQSRGYSLERVNEIFSKQRTDLEYSEFATKIIDNNSDEKALKKEIIRLVADLEGK